MEGEGTDTRAQDVRAQKARPPMIGLLVIELSRIVALAAMMAAFLVLSEASVYSNCSAYNCWEDEASRISAGLQLNGFLFLGWLLVGSVGCYALVRALRHRQRAWVVALLLVAAVGVAGLVGAGSKSGPVMDLTHQAVLSVLGPGANWGWPWLVSAAALVLVAVGSAAYAVFGQRRGART